MNFLIVTGLSGAGKSMAVNALEDIGFFCIDNIPVALLPRIVDFALQGENQLNRVAVVMDVRGVRNSDQLEPIFRLWLLEVIRDGNSINLSFDIKRRKALRDRIRVIRKVLCDLLNLICKLDK